MSTDLDKLNRLRVNAGKPELKSWKASKDALQVQIEKFEAEGFTDALPGAKIDAAPVTDDPVIAEVIAEQAEQDKPQSIADSAMAKNIANDPKPDVKPTTVAKAHLARGLDTDSYAAQSRLAVRMQREKENKAAKAERAAAKERAKADKPKGEVKLSKADKKQIADEAASRKIAGKVDAKKDPAKAKRQLDKVNAKQAARADKPKKEANPNEVTVAEIARELDIDPKVARAKLRRHEDKLTKLHTKGQDRWTFPKSAKPELVKILKGGK